MTGLDEDVGVDGCRDGRACRRISLMKWRSDGEFTLGITRVSRWRLLRTWVRSWRARPEDTEFIRTASLFRYWDQHSHEFETRWSE